MNLKNIKPSIRYLEEMGEVIYDKEWLKTAPKDLELYYMHRKVKEKDELEYDITIIPSQVLGQELVKTKGHQHKKKELYIVLRGEAIFLLQKNKGKIIEDVYAVRTRKGEAIIVPPSYQHLTINPSNQELRLGNWVSKKGGHDYSYLQKMNGACYFYIKSAEGKISWVKNKNYSKVPKLHFKKPLKSIPKNLDFLN